ESAEILRLRPAGSAQDDTSGKPRSPLAPEARSCHSERAERRGISTPMGQVMAVLAYSCETASRSLDCGLWRGLRSG
ncbi:MAG: hypothetical protein AAFQ43_02270, partial [Bacteroidota bacterium]